MVLQKVKIIWRYYLTFFPVIVLFILLVLSAEFYKTLPVLDGFCGMISVVVFCILRSKNVYKNFVTNIYIGFWGALSHSYRWLYMCFITDLTKNMN